MNTFSRKSDTNYANKLLNGIHASSQLAESSSANITYNKHVQNNEDENDNLNIELMSRVHKKYGDGNFASLFINSSKPKPSPYQPFPDSSPAQAPEHVERFPPLKDVFNRDMDKETMRKEFASICKVLTLSKAENKVFEEDSFKGFSSKIFSGSSLEIEESATTDTATNCDNEDAVDGNIMSSFENLTTEPQSASTSRNEDDLKNSTIERLLKMVAERDEEIVNLRQYCSGLNAFIKSIPTREQLSEQMREKIIGEMKANDTEFKNVKVENEVLKSRLSEMESFHHQKDKLIQDTMSKQLEYEQEIERLNMKLKDMEMAIDSERKQKDQLSLECARVQKEEREKGRLDSSKLWELERIDKIHLKDQLGYCMSKIKKLEDSLQESKLQITELKDEESKTRKMMSEKESEINGYKNEIANLKSLVLVSKTNNALIDTYKAKVEDLTHQLENEKMLNQTKSMLCALADSNIKIHDDESEDSLQKGINTIVDKIKATGKEVSVEHICDNMFNVQGKIVQLKLVDNKVCALRNNTPFPLELLLLH